MCPLSLTELPLERRRPPTLDIDAAIEQVGRIVLGKEEIIRLCVACLLARGHLLIEDIPGVGKTTLAHALASTLGLSFHRIQFTSDLLPADVLGVSVYEKDSGTFEFHPGPIFAQLILADEVNRATPKAQSALLEAMEERQVTQDGETRKLPQPFFVIATQNPFQQSGTFALPESQLDRFLMRVKLGYPDRDAERALLKGRDRRELMHTLTPCLDARALEAIQNLVPTVNVSDALLDYVQSLIAYTRDAPDYESGLSPRAGLAVLRSAQAWAVLQGRDYAIPEDIQAVLPSVASHRLRLTSHAIERDSGDVTESLLHGVPIP